MNTKDELDKIVDQIGEKLEEMKLIANDPDKWWDLRRERLNEDRDKSSRS